MKSLAPTSFDDVAALVALYRPGPMAANMHNDYADRKNGRQDVRYIHPDAEEVLADTYGLMIYQESVMRMSQRFAGYSLADADNLRKACGKKIRELMAKERAKFVDGCDATANRLGGFLCAPANLEFSSCFAGGNGGPGFRSVWTNQTPGGSQNVSTTAGLTLLACRSEGNGGYSEYAIEGGHATTLLSCIAYATTGAHCIAFGAG